MQIPQPDHFFGFGLQYSSHPATNQDVHPLSLQSEIIVQQSNKYEIHQQSKRRKQKVFKMYTHLQFRIVFCATGSCRFSDARFSHSHKGRLCCQIQNKDLNNQTSKHLLCFAIPIIHSLFYKTCILTCVHKQNPVSKNHMQQTNNEERHLHIKRDSTPMTN